MKTLAKPFLTNITLAVIFALHAMACSHKQQTPVVNQTTPTASLLLQRSENLIAEKRWNEARRLLKTVEASCGTDKRCNASRRFTLGYLYQQEGSNLDSAIIYYNQVLEQYPENASSYRNIALAYQQAGNTPRAIETLERAVKRGMTEEFAGKLADLYTQTNEQGQAIRMYNDALKKNPLSRPLHERLVDRYSSGYGNPTDMISHGRQMTNLGFHDLAARAFREAIKRYRTDERSAEVALFLWIISTSKIAEMDVDQLPTEWSHPGLKELQSLIKSSNRVSTSDLSWWRSSVDALPSMRPGERPLRRTAIIGYVLKYIGDRFERDGAFDLADDAYEHAYNVISENSIHMFVMRPDRIPDIFYDVAGARGILLTKYPQIDHSRQKFERMEEQLFEGKGAAYLNARTEPIMKFHTILGLIYAARSVWSPYGYRNAIFQLDRAIAKSPEQKNTGYLEILLADGYLEINDRRRACATLIDAAVDFLNDDDFYSCRNALSRYDSLRGERDATYRMVRNLLSFRSTLETVADHELNDVVAFTTSVYQATTAGEKNFGQLQRFKIFSDAGTVALHRELPNVGRYYHSLALMTSDSLYALANLTDVDRINNQVKSVLVNVQFDRAITSAAPLDAWPTNEESPRTKVWKIFEAGSSFDTHEIGLTRNLFTGAMIARALSRNDSLAQPKFLVTAEGKIYRIGEFGNEAVLMSEIR